MRILRRDPQLRGGILNPRQRRGVLLLAVAVVGLLAVAGGVASYVADVQSQLGPMRPVLRLTEDVDRLSAIPPDAVEVVRVPSRWAPDGTLEDPRELDGSVAAVDLPAGTQLQRASLTRPPEIDQGEREVAILVDPATGVGGKIRAGDVVDIYATFPAEPDGDGSRPARAHATLQAVRIVDIAPAVRAREGEEFAAAEPAVPVTFALTAEQALELAYLESFATELRLGLRLPSDTGTLGPGETEYTGPGR